MIDSGRLAVAETADVYHPGGPYLYRGDVMDLYDEWPTPTVIVSDGPYGLGSYPGDPSSPAGLPDWYRPHVEAWANRATPETTLWLWNSEIGWATIHPVLAEAGWIYRGCHTWDKGKAHIAGRTNTKTLRRFPVVTELCVQYVREVEFDTTVQSWLRSEWERTGLPFSAANKACGVKNAASRKYLASDHLWYSPPSSAFQRLVDYAAKHGDTEGRPYFSIDGVKPLTGIEWLRLNRGDPIVDLSNDHNSAWPDFVRRRAKFNCEFSVTNVWHTPPVAGPERFRMSDGKSLHINQKPLRLMDMCVRASSDVGDVVWEPFGGLCSASVAAHRLKRESYCAEISDKFFRTAEARLRHEQMNPVLFV